VVREGNCRVDQGSFLGRKIKDNIKNILALADFLYTTVRNHQIMIQVPIRTIQKDFVHVVYSYFILFLKVTGSFRKTEQIQFKQVRVLRYFKFSEKSIFFFIRKNKSYLGRSNQKYFNLSTIYDLDSFE